MTLYALALENPTKVFAFWVNKMVDSFRIGVLFLLVSCNTNEKDALPGDSEDGTRDPTCSAFASCAQAVSAPDAAEISDEFGPHGSCWDEASGSTGCVLACVDGLANLVVGHPRRTEDCAFPRSYDGSTLVIDGTTWSIKHAVARPAGSGWNLWLATWPVHCDWFIAPDAPSTTPRVTMQVVDDLLKVIVLATDNPDDERLRQTSSFVLRQTDDWSAASPGDELRGVLAVSSDDTHGAVSFEARYCE